MSVLAVDVDELFETAFALVLPGKRLFFLQHIRKTDIFDLFAASKIHPQKTDTERSIFRFLKLRPVNLLKKFGKSVLPSTI